MLKLSVKRFREGPQPSLPPKRNNHMDSLREVFATFDKDGSGTIDAAELKECLNAMGRHPGPLELEELLREMDTDGNGVIDFDEFAAVMGDEEQADELEEELRDLRSMFVMLDQDGNGCLSADELRHALRSLGVELNKDEAEFLVKEIDANGDGDVSFEEFTEYVMKFDPEEYKQREKHEKWEERMKLHGHEALKTNEKTDK